jgi:CheY-like chemotaxis protein
VATILVVDANPANRRWYIALLGNYGHRLLEASDGVEALALAQLNSLN